MRVPATARRADRVDGEDLDRLADQARDGDEDRRPAHEEPLPLAALEARESSPIGGTEPLAHDIGVDSIGDDQFVRPARHLPLPMMRVFMAPHAMSIHAK